MKNLRKFTLTFDESKDAWSLVNDRTNRVLRNFDSKADATAGGALRRVLGEQGGSVKIQKENGRFQEERTFPSSADPHSSVG